MDDLPIPFTTPEVHDPLFTGEDVLPPPSKIKRGVSQWKEKPVDVMPPSVLCTYTAALIQSKTAAERRRDAELVTRLGATFQPPSQDYLRVCLEVGNSVAGALDSVTVVHCSDEVLKQVQEFYQFQGYETKGLHSFVNVDYTGAKSVTHALRVWM